MDEDATDTLLRALADATRRSLLDRLRDSPGLTLGALAAGFPLTRQALSKHLAVLESASLVVTLWRGREKLHYLDPRPLQALPARWVTTTQRERSAALTALQQAQAAHAQPAAAAGAQDAVLAALQAPGEPALDGTRIGSDAALAAARQFLAGTADAVQRLLEALGALPAAAATTRPATGGFSLTEHLWHLADIEQLGWSPRAERLLHAHRPRLPGVDGDRLAAMQRYQERPWRGAARRFVAQRRRTLRTLASFDTAVLARPAVFAGQRCTAGDVLAAMVAHDREHRDEMARLWNTVTTTQGDRR
ncbi:DinB family protein [Rubrivivax sp. RP6-9]|uniref:DinB family protein n=1 Tax=Rubrivivax sp. RP6-9 TaxID=3415750 RepID=UPI003CC62ABD